MLPKLHFTYGNKLIDNIWKRKAYPPIKATKVIG